jgi:hypothetical protein
MVSIRHGFAGAAAAAAAATGEDYSSLPPSGAGKKKKKKNVDLSSSPAPARRIQPPRRNNQTTGPVLQVVRSALKVRRSHARLIAYGFVELCCSLTFVASLLAHVDAEIESPRADVVAFNSKIRRRQSSHGRRRSSQGGCDDDDDNDERSMIAGDDDQVKGEVDQVKAVATTTALMTTSSARRTRPRCISRRAQGKPLFDRLPSTSYCSDRSRLTFGCCASSQRSSQIRSRRGDRRRFKNSQQSNEETVVAFRLRARSAIDV